MCYTEQNNGPEVRNSLKIRTLPVPAPIRLKIAVCADFHSVNRPMPVERALRLLRDASPDMILFPGDLFSDTGRTGLRDCFNRNGHFYPDRRCGAECSSGLAWRRRTFSRRRRYGGRKCASCYVWSYRMVDCRSDTADFDFAFC